MTAAVALACAAILPGCGSQGKTTVRVPTDAMLPKYDLGDKVEVDTDNRTPAINRIVLFRAPLAFENGGCAGDREKGQPCPRSGLLSRNVKLILRVIAGPGDRVAFRGGVAIVNGEPESGLRLRIDDALCGACDLPVDAVVPPGHWFLAGDNRSVATDSRQFGAVPGRAVVARVVGPA